MDVMGSRDDFTYDHERDIYLCPGGRVLTTTGTLVNDGTTVRHLIHLKGATGHSASSYAQAKDRGMDRRRRRAAAQCRAQARRNAGQGQGRRPGRRGRPRPGAKNNYTKRVQLPRVTAASATAITANAERVKITFMSGPFPFSPYLRSRRAAPGRRRNRRPPRSPCLCRRSTPAPSPAIARYRARPT